MRWWGFAKRQQFEGSQLRRPVLAPIFSSDKVLPDSGRVSAPPPRFPSPGELLHPALWQAAV
eukprot:5504927-Pyramimonas_sp.AAC.1